METKLENMTVGAARYLFKKHARTMSGVSVLNVDDFLDAVGDFLPILSVQKQLVEALEWAIDWCECHGVEVPAEPV